MTVRIRDWMIILLRHNCIFSVWGRNHQRFPCEFLSSNLKHDLQEHERYSGFIKEAERTAERSIPVDPKIYKLPSNICICKPIAGKKIALYITN